MTMNTGVTLSRAGVEVYIGDYHREQAWQRWMMKVGSVDAEGLRTKLRRVANALTVDDVDRTLAELESSSSSRLGNWFSNTWKPHLMASLCQCSVCYCTRQLNQVLLGFGFFTAASNETHNG